MVQWLLLHTIVVALLAALAMALGRWRRLSPAARHLLWLVVLVKLLTPPVLVWPWALPTPFGSPTLPDSPRAIVAEVAHEDAEEAVVAMVAVPLPPAEMQLFAAETDSTSAVEAETAVATEWLPGWGALVWLVGGLVMAVTQLVRIVRFRQRVAAAPATTDELTKQVAAVATDLGIGPPPVRVVPGLPSPMVWGWGAPQLLWPRGLESRLAPEGRQAVLIHELA